MKVLIKGAGDLASGIACRLFMAGFDLMMTEIPIPTTVRRTVAFSRAVYEGEAEVEGICALRCENVEEVQAATEKGCIAVAVDPACDLARRWKPDVAVDAILAKRNLGTKLEDAGIVIGVGPGFTAGKDCHVVVETKRGHDLGRCIWEGEAAPNTGVPGMIGGYGIERLLRAGADGIFMGEAGIGDLAEQGGRVGVVRTESGEEVPVLAQTTGVIRGLLQDGVPVTAGMKAGDVDPRGLAEYCNTVSDKARAIGGGVLEAILACSSGRRRMIPERNGSER